MDSKENVDMENITSEEYYGKFAKDDWQEEIDRRAFLVDDPEEIDQVFLRKVEALGFEEAIQVNELEDLLVRTTIDN